MENQAAPTAAGIYDYMLGGDHHSAADREAAERAMAFTPAVRAEVLENRAFMRRAVRYIASQGVRQYIDLGSGFPAAGPVHEVAAEFVTDPRVLYVDYDPRVADLSRRTLRSHPNAGVIIRDVRDPWDIIDDPVTARLIDWSEPVAMLMVSILHFIGDDENPAEIIATFRDRMASGSYLVVSHASAGDAPDLAEKVRKEWDGARSEVLLRTPREVEDFFVGFEMTGPGLVSTTEWGTGRPAPTGQGVILAAVARVP